MAKARMLHKKISLSEDVNKLPLPARLLFTWMIPHADDEGRLKGEPLSIRVTVVPYLNWSNKLILSYLNLMSEIGLISYWQENGHWYIEFPKWNDYQAIRKDRFEPSKLPSYNAKSEHQLVTKRQPRVNQTDTQYSEVKDNTIQVKKSEEKSLADNNPYKEENGENPTAVQNPKLFHPTNAGESGALMAWEKLEPDNSKAFYTTYLKAHRDGLPYSYFFLFTSEIKQDKTIINRGAVFTAKVKSYFEKKASTSG